MRDEVPKFTTESEATFARETGWVVSNFLVSQGVFVLSTLATAWPSLHSQTEVAEGLMILAIVLVPAVFLVVYPLLRFGARAVYRRHTHFQSLAGAWLPGATVATVALVFCKLMGALQKVIGH
jgi:hypothetical protein